MINYILRTILEAVVAVASIKLIMHFKENIWGNKKEVGMAVLGIDQSGKTTWYDYLCKTNRNEKGTTKDDIDAFTLKFDDGKKVHIKDGIDIGGGGVNISPYYENMINENDVILFFFNAKKYIEETEYMRECNARLDFINNKIKIYNLYNSYNDTSDIITDIITGITNNKRCESKKIYIIMTFADQLKDRTKAYKQAYELLKSRPYIKEMTDNFVLINMTDEQEKKELKEKMFGEYKK